MQLYENRCKATGSRMRCRCKATYSRMRCRCKATCSRMRFRCKATCSRRRFRCKATCNRMRCRMKCYMTRSHKRCIHNLNSVSPLSEEIFDKGRKFSASPVLALLICGAPFCHYQHFSVPHQRKLLVQKKASGRATPAGYDFFSLFPALRSQICWG